MNIYEQLQKIESAAPAPHPIKTIRNHPKSPKFKKGIPSPSTHAPNPLALRHAAQRATSKQLSWEWLRWICTELHQGSRQTSKKLRCVAHNIKARRGRKHQTVERAEPTDERGRGEPTGPRTGNETEGARNGGSQGQSRTRRGEKGDPQQTEIIRINSIYIYIYIYIYIIIYRYVDALFASYILFLYAIITLNLHNSPASVPPPWG